VKTDLHSSSMLAVQYCVSSAPRSNDLALHVARLVVKDIRAKRKQLIAAGVVFERYGTLQQDELGIWASPSGARVA